MTETNERRPGMLQAEHERLYRTERLLLVAAYLAFASMVVLGVVTSDAWPVWAAVAGALVFAPSIVLWHGERLHAAALAMSSAALLVVAGNVAAGQGLHDLSMLGMPLVMLFAGLTLPRRTFLWFSAVTVSMAVAAGIAGSIGLTSIRETEPGTFTSAWVVGNVLVVTAASVSILGRGLQENLARAHRELELRHVAEAELAQLTITDSMTRTYNRRYFDDRADRLDEEGVSPVAVIVADVDDLKTINDTRGHLAGDQVLVEAATLLAGCVRDSDILARIGGDEFAILLPDTQPAEASLVESRIRSALEEARVGRSGPVLSMSVGVASAAAHGVREAIERADQAMYSAKQLAKSSA